MNLAHCTIVAPIDGIVIQRSVDVGQTVAASVQAPVLFVIAADLRRMQIELDLDESDIGGIQNGEPVSFQVESYPNETFSGTVASIRIQPVAEQTTTATSVPTSTSPSTTTTIATVIGYPVMIDVANPDEKLRPGMTATVTLNGLRRDAAIRIPNNALSFRPAPEVLAAAGQSNDTGVPRSTNGGDEPTRQVWTYDGRRFAAVAVKTGLTDGQWTELVGGRVGVGEELVTNASLGRE